MNAVRNIEDRVPYCLACDRPCLTHGPALCCVPCGLLFTPMQASGAGRGWTRSKLPMWLPAMKEMGR